MMNRLLVVCTLMLFFLLPIKANDVVLIKIDGDNVYLSEFLYSYDKVRELKECTVIDYFQDFLKCKLKVADARERGMDDECFMNRFDFIKYKIHHDAHHVENIHNMVKLCLLNYRLPQSYSNISMHNADMLMTDIYKKLMSGISVSDVISMNKDSHLCFEDFDDKWLDRTFILDEINFEIDKLGIGDISKPVYSPEGIHIVFLKDKCDKKICCVDSFLMHKQIEEALLISEWNKKTKLPYCSFSDKVLQSFYKRNKAKYRWEFPHYKGMVLHCNSKKTASKLKKRIKKQPIEKWSGIIDSFCSDYNIDVKYEIGLFVIGENKYVDKLAFGCGDFDEVNNYTHTTVVGRCLDYEPEDFKDVYDDVVKDYMKEGEELYFNDLEKKFNVEKHIDVLKTVNCSVSN